MALVSGARLGPYEILTLLGSGGMGEVYRAKDTKLGRDVALKILPGEFTHNPKRIARFTREAQVLASLNHPHIGGIYGLEEADGAQFLVLELVDGETLAQRIARGPIPLEEALSIARQIAYALEAAHEKGIIHRDLKPANIALTANDQVKVLDFGLAKALEGEGRSDLSNSPTLTLHATQAGVILGTAAYMSPEQAKGRVADKRSDIWAFGCVLFEMLTGTRAFEGEDVSDTSAAVLRGAPDWSALPSNVPPSIHTLVQRCLEKDRQRRTGDISVALFVINESTIVAPSPGITAAPVANMLRGRLLSVASASLIAGACLMAVVTWPLMHWGSVPKQQPVRFGIVPPAAQPLALNNADRQLALSPDGRHLVYVAGAGGQTQLMVRALDRLEAEPLLGTTGARAPFISPDGRWVGFSQGTYDLRKVSIAGGPPITLCRISGAPRGASWGPDDTVVFATNDTSTGLLSVPGGGGEPKVLTKPDLAHGELDHLFPSVLPGGRAVLFTITAPGSIENAQVAVLDFQTGQRKTLIRGGSHAEYVETGHLVYAAAGALRAVRFDPVRFEVLSDPVLVVEQVAMTGSGAAEFSVSRTGTLVYMPGGLTGQLGAARSLVWVNRQGREEPINAPRHAYVALRLSPDGTRIALDSRDQENDIWVWDLARQTLTRLIFDPGLDVSPVWTPDGRRIVFGSTRGGGVVNLFWQASDGTGTVERLTTSGNLQVPDSFLPDGTQLIVREQLGKTGNDLSVLAMDGKAQPMPLIQTMFDELNADISPDGRWLAYQSNQSGPDQIYVQPFPNVNSGRWQISTDGGTKPVWAPSGRELFYLDGGNVLVTVPVQTTPRFSAGNPTRLLQTRSSSIGQASGRPYDISRDGQRFVMIKDASAADQTSTSPPASMVVVLNWFEDLKARAPVK